MNSIDETTSRRDSPLRAEHEALGASFTDFGGWMMPVRYGSDLAEHHAVRHAAGLFDISHMGELRITGADAASFLDLALASPALRTGGGAREVHHDPRRGRRDHRRPDRVPAR